MNVKPTQSKIELSNSSETTDRNEFSNSNIIALWEMPWQKAIIVSIFMLLVFITVVGNTLVILSVLTTKRLRTVTNCYVTNLAVTDWLVGTCVMPPSILFYIVGSWRFGWILCNIWISLDILLCTASILSLCAISLDRYLAVIQPLKYSKRRRSKRLALLMILVVWVVAFLITCPPIFGWYKPDGRNKHHVECRYNQNKGYVIFSAMGSFFIPLGVMLYVYLRIGFVLTSRQQRMVRDAVSEKSTDNKNERTNFVQDHEHCDCESNYSVPVRSSLLMESKTYNPNKADSLEEVTFYDPVTLPKISSAKRCSAISCGKSSTTQSNVNFAETSKTYSESCLSKIEEDYAKNRNSNNFRMSQTPSLRVPMRVSTNRKETKTTKTLTTVMGGFIACWLPFFCYYLLIPFLPPKAVSEGLMYFFTWVGWINCAINPFIYAFYNPEFCTAFWRLTFHNIVKKRSKIRTNING
ncbi:5-hydroxytryptamine receptor 1D [Episyrphus balteatus]|uniref:5-hydroxytryptamine receptor 1D n=1 Tax=Episyrphus balteatus TaxID=286459 RepID=UPI0024857411|nr:5-hydroxytryptamine receptor 1D [Episyrphus balteatus]XP_055853070.1 5-hydroxytryptamine receptor 1D [Episyrphus balteatus]XP_055853071.1 5-hydroxytryptamine receptor 1D [Episyrphus balteatus]